MKGLFSTLLIIFLLGCVVVLTFTVFNNVVDISDISLEEDNKAAIEIDFDRNGKKDKIEIRGLSISQNVVPTSSASEYKLSVNGQEFMIITESGKVINSLAVVDLNGDLINEILLSVNDISDSTTYKEWMVYSFDSGFLRYLGKIYDGNISYNYLTNKLLVIYKLHGTEHVKFDYKTYDLSFFNNKLKTE